MKTSFPKDKIKITLLENIHDLGAQTLNDEGFSVTRVAGSPDADALKSLLATTHVLGIRSKTHLTDDLLEAAPKLLAIGCFCIGTDQVDLQAAKERGIPVFNSPFGNTRSVAELTIAEIVMLSRGIVSKSMAMHRGQWNKSASGAHEVRGRTVGIVGYGHIGSQVSVLAESLGMRVIYYDIVPKLALGNATQVDSLVTLLSQADFVTLHVPATDATRQMIGQEQIAAMKPGAALLNNARGHVVNLSAVRDALNSGHLSGGAFDVFPVEPHRKDEPFSCELCEIDKVILTPHIGGSTIEAQETIARDVATKLTRFINVGSTTGAVNVPNVELPSQSQTSPQGQRPHRVLHFHANVPGVLGTINSQLAKQGVNVYGQYLRTDNTIGYVVFDIDPSASEAAVNSLSEVPQTIRTRVLW